MVVFGSHIGVTSVGSSFNELLCSRVGTFGLEMLVRIIRDKKEIQRHKIELGGQY